MKFWLLSITIIFASCSLGSSSNRLLSEEEGQGASQEVLAFQDLVFASNQYPDVDVRSLLEVSADGQKFLATNGEGAPLFINNSNQSVNSLPLSVFSYDESYSLYRLKGLRAGGQVCGFDQNGVFQCEGFIWDLAVNPESDDSITILNANYIDHSQQTQSATFFGSLAISENGVVAGLVRNTETGSNAAVLWLNASTAPYQLPESTFILGFIGEEALVTRNQNNEIQIISIDYSNLSAVSYTHLTLPTKRIV